LFLLVSYESSVGYAKKLLVLPFCISALNTAKAILISAAFMLRGRPLKNANFCSSSRKAKILTTGIHLVFRGLKFEPDTEIGQKGAFCKGLRGCLANEPRSTQDEISGQGSFENVFLILTTIVPKRNSKKISRGRSQRPFAKQMD